MLGSIEYFSSTSHDERKMRVHFDKEFSRAVTDDDALLVAERVEETLGPELIKIVDEYMNARKQFD